MTEAMRKALAQGVKAPSTPDTDNPSLVLVDAVTGADQTWIERARFRPIMRSRANKPKSRHANKLDRHANIRTRKDARYPGAVTAAPTVLQIMRRSGYIVKSNKGE